MKTRSGFVSNSSSSSFIVAFDRKITKKYLKEVIFNNCNSVTYDTWGGSTSLSTNHLVDVIMENKKGPISLDEIESKISPTGDDEYGWEDDYQTIQFIKDNDGKFIYEFEFSDNNGNAESYLEHEGTFERMPHIVFSHH